MKYLLIAILLLMGCSSTHEGKVMDKYVEPSHTETYYRYLSKAQPYVRTRKYIPEKNHLVILCMYHKQVENFIISKSQYNKVIIGSMVVDSLTVEGL